MISGVRTASSPMDEARRRAGLSMLDLWLRYVELGGSAPLERLTAFVEGTEDAAAFDHDVIAHALNERSSEVGLAPLLRYTSDPLVTERRAGRLGTTQPRPPIVSVIIPTLNEAENLPYVLARLPAEVGEVIVVDGHSTDDTVAVALAYRPDAKIVLQDGTGKGNALACGYRAVTGDITVMIDADGSTDPAEIPRFVEALTDGADVAKGTRFAPGGGSNDMTRLRWMGNRAFTMLVNLIWRSRYTDLCYGYNAWWSRHLEHVPTECNGFEVETLINIRLAAAGLKVTEVPSFEANRRHGRSHLNAARDGMRVLRTIIAEVARPR